MTDEQLTQKLDIIEENNKRIRAERFKAQHDAITDAMTTAQYFKWHREHFDGNLDYKSQAWSIFHSTKSKKIRALCLVQIEYYDQCFGTSGFKTLKSKAV